METNGKANQLPVHAADLSAALKKFHRALIRAEIGDDPTLQNPYTMLFALISDPRFAWMGALSGLITRIDQMVADEELNAAGLCAFRDDAAALLGEGEGQLDPTFRLRHLAALQTEPEVGFATGRLRRVLSSMASAG